MDLFNEEDDFLLDDYDSGTMTESELNDIDDFFKDIVETTSTEKKRKETLILAVDNCKLNNPNVKTVNYSRAIRFCYVVNEILSPYENPMFDFVRNHIMSLKKSNSYKDHISRHKVLHLLIQWEYMDILSYIAQIVCSESGINFSKLFNTCMNNIPRCSKIFNSNFDNKLIFREEESKGINVYTFRNIEQIAI